MPKVAINAKLLQCSGGTEFRIVSKIEKSAKRWARPELTKLGTLRDVAGSNTVSANTRTANFRNPS